MYIVKGTKGINRRLKKPKTKKKVQKGKKKKKTGQTEKKPVIRVEKDQQVHIIGI